MTAPYLIRLNHIVHFFHPFFACSFFVLAYSCNKADDSLNTDRSKVSDKVEEIAGRLPGASSGAGGLPRAATSSAGAGVEGTSHEAHSSAPSRDDHVDDAKEAVILMPGVNAKVLRYAFVPNRVETRSITLSSESGHSPQPPLKLNLQFTCKSKKVDGGCDFEVKLLQASFPTDALPPQMKTQLMQMSKNLDVAVGSTFLFSASSLGEVSQLSVDPKGTVDRRAMQFALPAIAQVVALVFPPLPKEAIGQQGKWAIKRRDESGAGFVASEYTLESFSGASGKVSATVKQDSPKHLVEAREAPPGTTLSSEGRGSYVYHFSLDGLPSSIVGEMADKDVIEIPKQPAVTQESKFSIRVASGSK